MRILFTFIGGLGHFEPLVPVARAAAASGHEVAVAGSGGLAGKVEAAGFTFLPTSAVRVAAAQPPERDLTPLAPVDRYAAEVEFAENFADKGARRHATAIQQHIRDWRPEVVVHDEADLGSAIAAEVLDVPTATVLVLAAGMLIRPELVSAPLATLRAEHGLPADPGLAMLTRGLVLSPFPPSVRSPSSPVPLPETTFSFRPVDRVPITRRSSTQRVYVTLGTEFNSTSGDLFERLLSGLAGVDADVVVTVGRDVDPAEFGGQPAHVRVERFVPQAQVLCDSDLVISHGGSGSLLATLAHGLPSVLLPLGADQPHNALRAEELGLARTLDAATATPDAIRRTVNEALHDDVMIERARRMADEFDRLPGVEETVPLLEVAAATASSAPAQDPPPENP
jgi:UDP:flavonoid glycosyltransferase YjiC (YdhE family)